MAKIILQLSNSISHAAYQNEDMPPPSNYTSIKQDRYISWDIDGFFGTSKGKEYLRDVAQNLSIHFKLEIKDIIYTDKHKICGQIYKLGEFKYLKNLRTVKAKYSGLGMATDDELFDDMRMYAMQMSRENYCSIELLKCYGETLTSDWKKVKMKAKAIQRWIDDTYQYKDYGAKKSYAHTRTENAEIQRNKISSDKYKEFLNYVKNNSIKNISSLASALNIAWRTAKKYFLKWLDNRIKTARNSAMIFIGSIRGTAALGFKAPAVLNIPKCFYVYRAVKKRSKFISIKINNKYEHLL